MPVHDLSRSAQRNMHARSCEDVARAGSFDPMSGGASARSGALGPGRVAGRCRFSGYSDSRRPIAGASNQPGSGTAGRPTANAGTSPISALP